MVVTLAPRRARRFRREEVTSAEWNDWRWQLRHRVETEEELAQLVDLTDEERRGLAVAPGLFRVGATPYYAALMDRADPRCPIRLQVIPTPEETEISPGEYVDPLGEDALLAAPCVVHRYPDRVLLFALDRCAVYCRHCNRRRLVGQESGIVARDQLEAGLDYIRRTPAIKDVLVSGGDPLTLATEKLSWLLGEIRAIPHVDIVRIGTRVPVCLPMRIDAELCAALSRHHPLYINTHFNHPREVTPEARAACGRLADAGVPLGNQTVLLRGVNSDGRIIERLNRELLRMRVRPYYLFQGDPVTGTDHLRTPVAVGLGIMEHLRGRISGLGIPHFVIDAPGGGGKIPLGPDYVLEQGDGRYILRTWKNERVTYVEPAPRDCSCSDVE